MNRKTLQKIIDNLRSEKPDLSYVLGILDTLIETLPEEKSIAGTVSPQGNIPVNTASTISSAIIPPISPARLKEIQEITAKSRE